MSANTDSFNTIESLYHAIFNERELLIYVVLTICIISLALWVVWRKLRQNKAPGAQSNTVDGQPSAKEQLSSRSGVLPEAPKTLAEQIQTGLQRTRKSIWEGFDDLISGKVKFNQEVLEKLHESLYRSDIGVQTTDKIINSLKQSLQNKNDPSWEDLQSAIAKRAEEILSGPESPMKTDSVSPCIILVVGVNGVGKTTTIGKLASHYKAQGKSVLLAAADTYRAAAIEQLNVWGERLDLKVVAHQANADPAAVAYDAVKAAVARKCDVLLIDTAGRLHNKENLMKELNKINRVISKDLPAAPHETLLVLDATVGQNAFSQVESFKEIVDLTGIVVTKLDGTAKGGVVIGLADRFKIPIRFVGIGEKADDLKPFNPKDFAKSIVY